LGTNANQDQNPWGAPCLEPGLNQLQLKQAHSRGETGENSGIPTVFIKKSWIYFQNHATQGPVEKTTIFGGPPDLEIPGKPRNSTLSPASFSPTLDRTCSKSGKKW